MLPQLGHQLSRPDHQADKHGAGLGTLLAQVLKIGQEQVLRHQDPEILAHPAEAGTHTQAVQPGAHQNEDLPVQDLQQELQVRALKRVMPLGGQQRQVPGGHLRGKLAQRAALLHGRIGKRLSARKGA